MYHSSSRAHLQKSSQQNSPDFTLEAAKCFFSKSFLLCTQTNALLQLSRKMYSYYENKRLHRSLSFNSIIKSRSTREEYTLRRSRSFSSLTAGSLYKLLPTSSSVLPKYSYLDRYYHRPESRKFNYSSIYTASNGYGGKVFNRYMPNSHVYWFSRYLTPTFQYSLDRLDSSRAWRRVCRKSEIQAELILLSLLQN